ncbi:MAG: hypothetical protein EBQ68_10500, partial [Betaproteobacteria bacterium]|nr:hypothetical protein [Betaproteobacteria bacterium]
GFRPTVGRYSGTGIIPISHTRDTAGPITRSVEDAALMDSVLCGAALGLDKINLQGLRLGVHAWTFTKAQTPRCWMPWRHC